MVPSRDDQADILVQAVQNHNPDVIIVDEIGTSKVWGGGQQAALC
jgi:stage III sporulation protein SpoIIIAA